MGGASVQAELGVVPDLRAYNALLDTLGKAGEVRKMERVRAGTPFSSISSFLVTSHTGNDKFVLDYVRLCSGSPNPRSIGGKPDSSITQSLRRFKWKVSCRR